MNDFLLGFLHCILWDRHQQSPGPEDICNCKCHQVLLIFRPVSTKLCKCVCVKLQNEFHLSFSGNQEHSASSQLYKIKGIDVKYSIFATIERFVFFYVKQRK